MLKQGLETNPFSLWFNDYTFDVNITYILLEAKKN